MEKKEKNVCLGGVRVENRGGHMGSVALQDLRVPDAQRVPEAVGS